MKKYSIVVYISGKISAPTKSEMERYIRYAARINKVLWENGFTTICPHTNAPANANIDYEDYMSGDFELLKRCDCVLMLPNWKRSLGATRELVFADKINMPVFFSLKELILHYKKGGQNDDTS